ncbi:putative colanic acid biosynthesis acetyltransferase WcaF [Christiangramia gaetbulicola]|uniref:Putative colanic acid biosynthesis acetyltransferase WcaF n=1 Tax=Christiangramia gaetbulicola TaxID=703340 RepID=A0A2T6AND9_9FLAO|nr:putative colanic acid biosynthesis acetyltransferase [Christiangramia gaetbulicola]PTX45342.1 putative colanic acid biosynthesis acetyltransferase WcaF [Christiangramia gaetbulicola]
MDLSAYNSSFSLKNKCARVLWGGCYWLLFRPFNLPVFSSWRSMILRLFRAKVAKGANIYASARIWAPWNFEIGEFSSIGPKADIYNQGKIVIGSNTVISQKAYLCASTHNHNLPSFPLITKPIIIGDQVWVAAAAFIGPGVQIEHGAVVGARSAVFKNVAAWTVVGGNPAKYIMERNIRLNGSAKISEVNFKVRDSGSTLN